MSDPTAATRTRPHLSVVVPARDDQDRIEETVERIAGYFGRRGTTHEVVVVDEGSTDRTHDRAERAVRRGVGRVVRLDEPRGTGAAVRAGVLAARGRRILVTDPGLPVPLETYERLARVCREHDLDGAIASLRLPESDIGSPAPPASRAAVALYRTWVRLVARLPFRDPSCPFKLFDRRRVLPLFEQSVVDGLAWDVECLFLASRLSISLAEVPVRVPGDGRPSRRASPAETLRAFADVARVRWRFRRGDYPGAGTGVGD